MFIAGGTLSSWCLSNQEENIRMNISRYILLIHKHLKGKISPQEMTALDEWRSEEKHAQLENQLHQVWELSGRYKEAYEPDVEVGLANFQARISTDRKAAKRPLRRLPLYVVSIAAAFALLVAAGWWLLYDNAPSGEFLTYTTGPEEIQSIDLPDGSSVYLNEKSMLTYQLSESSKGERKLSLQGEAYFKVEPDASRPFIIKTPGTEVKVLGTAFNLRAYEEEPFTEVEVEEGKVAFRSQDSGKELLLTQREKGLHLSNGDMVEQEQTLLNAHSWRTEVLTFRNTPVREALKDLERHYDVSIKAQNLEQWGDCPFSSTLDKESLEDALQLLSAIFGVEVDQPEEGTVLLSNGRCTPINSGAK